jgi:retinol dehydrogenase-12
LRNRVGNRTGSCQKRFLFSNYFIAFFSSLIFFFLDARVILACRDEAKGKEAVEKIKAESKNEDVELELLDLASLNSIRAFADRIKAKLQRLDILVNNAGLDFEFYLHFTLIYNNNWPKMKGLGGVPYKKTEDGFELQFGVMHLGHFLLTNLLLDLLKKSAPSRIINVSSLGHKGIDMNWDDLQSEKSYSSLFSYRQAKLANILFTVELARRLKGE